MPKPNNTTHPKNWPPSITYLTHPLYSRTLHPSHLAHLRDAKHARSSSSLFQIPSTTPRGPCSLVKITAIRDERHPANGQCGLFATGDLRPGGFVLVYLGVVHGGGSQSVTSDPPSSPSSTNTPTLSTTTPNPNPNPPPNPPSPNDPHATSNYDLSLDRDLALAIDANHAGNEARFINDYRGVAERPNAEFREVWDGRSGERGMGVFVLGEGKKTKGRKGIKKGQEILVSYGRGFWGARREVEVQDEEEAGDGDVNKPGDGDG